MIDYLIARNRTQTEWLLTEADKIPGKGRRDIFKLPHDESPMVSVLLFQAPGWEQAKAIYDGVLNRYRLHRFRYVPSLRSWDQAKILAGLEKAARGGQANQDSHRPKTV